MESAGASVGDLAVISPVFNDWVCADELVARLAALSSELPPMTVFLVDDGSTDPVSLTPERWAPGLRAVHVVHAGANLGHQRAIAVGLAAAVSHAPTSTFAVIDADGEDDPAGLPRLLQVLPTSGAAVVVAKRDGRTENLSFRTFYRLYRWGFRLLTGRPLDFGNFCVMTGPAAQRLLYMPELWNHFPATVMRSRLPLTKVPTDRSTRFHGESRMNFVSLVNHGLAAISTFGDVVFARLLILVSILSGLFLAAAVAVASVRLLTSLAIPGWATAATGFIVLALLQLLALLAVMTFIQLSARSTIPPTPRASAPDYTRSVTQVFPR